MLIVNSKSTNREKKGLIGKKCGGTWVRIKPPVDLYFMYARQFGAKPFYPWLKMVLFFPTTKILVAFGINISIFLIY